MPGRRLVRRSDVARLASPVVVASPRLGSARRAGRSHVPRLVLNLPCGDARHARPFRGRAAPRAAMRPVRLSRHLGRLRRSRPGVRRRCPRSRRRPAAAAIAVVARMLAPAIWSALAIGFAESVSDFGVAATLAYTAHFPLITYQLYAAIGNFPAKFPGAAAMGWLLVGSVASPLALQARALAGRSYAVLSGRTRPLSAVELTPTAATAAVGGCRLLLRRLRSAVPGLGAISGSLLGDYGSSFKLTFVNYHAVFSNSELFGPLERSLVYGVDRRHGHGGRRVRCGAAARDHADQVDKAARLPAARSGRAAERRVRGRLHLRLQPPDHVAARASTSTRRPRCSSSPTWRPASRRTPGSSLARSPNFSRRCTTPPAPMGRAASRLGAGSVPGDLAGPSSMAWLLTFSAVFSRAADLPAALCAELATGLGCDRGQPWELPLRCRDRAGRDCGAAWHSRPSSLCSAPTDCLPRRDGAGSERCTSG